MMLKTPYSKSNKKMCENEIENTLEIFEVICNLNVSFWIMIQKYIKIYDIEINQETKCSMRFFSKLLICTNE